MARLWGDGFDHYGTDEDNMLDGAYATYVGSLSTDHVATGTHSFYVSSQCNSGAFDGLRKVLPSSKTKMGASGRFYFPSLPRANDAAMIFGFHSSNANQLQIAICVDANGAFRVYRGGIINIASGNVGTLIATSDPLIVASAFNHIEVQVNISDTVGWVRIAVNGVHRWETTGLDTQFDGTGIVSVSNFIHPNATGGSAGNSPFYFDDYTLYDFTGTAATDTDWCPTVDGAGIGTNYIGELQGMLCLATADTAEADWAKSTGSTGFDLIGKATPNDATYISSGTATDLSEFTLTDLPADITYIRGLDFHSRISKSDAGSAMYKVGMKSVAATSDATEIPMTVEPTYWFAQINVDPNASARWTRAAFNAAWLRQLRSA